MPALLGAHLVGEVRAELAARLLEEWALILLNPLQAHEPLSPGRFVRATAVWIEGATEQTAAWDVSAVLSVAADTGGEELTRRILLQLPAGYDLLFGPPSAYSPGAATTLPLNERLPVAGGRAPRPPLTDHLRRDRQPRHR